MHRTKIKVHLTILGIGFGVASAALAGFKFDPIPRSDFSVSQLTSKSTSRSTDASRRKLAIFEWQSEVDGSPAVTLVVSSTVGRVALVARCRENKTALMLFNTNYIGSDQQNVLVRWDDKPANHIAMTPATSGRAMFFPNPIHNIKRISGSTSVIVRYTDAAASPSTEIFDIPDMKVGVGKLSKACGWSAN